jgi:hypothetical protein
MNGADEGLLRQAVILSRECGIPPCDVHDAAARAMDSAVRMPPGRRFACIASALRRELARHLGVPRRTLPRDWAGLKAVGRYEASRVEYHRLRGRTWGRAFDRHSRLFAVENGVCPRCARPGKFAAAAGRCPCGFQYE